MALALFVTFLWSTSWVLIKLGLRDLAPLSFAGLRYVLAALLLLPALALRPADRAALRGMGPREWLELAGLGLVLYAVTQGAQFAALALLPAASVGIVLAFSPLAVAVASAPLLHERLERRQAAGLLLFLAGALLYFGAGAWPVGRAAGLAAALLALVANAAASILGRAVNRRGRLSPLAVTAVSMGLGSAALLATGVAIEGLPRPTPAGWAILGWLAAVNTALAFTLWNRALQRLTATESSLLNNTMLVQVAVLAWLFLGERLGGREITGLAVALAGVALAQLRGRRPR
ncbi:MAG TPA: DMT family transporter [Thermoanaerobaculia bacterium]|nr:DMT family transporter [Thermoanaerobaculia bacterium]